MLISLHVKNLALIEEAEIDFTEGLNVMTGETGAGKSVIIGSVNLALGAKADKEYIRSGAEYALVELIFGLENEAQSALVAAMGVKADEDGVLILQRKVMPSRSICKINGETVSAGQLRNLASVLLDIHGQHEHQSLLKAASHKDILDGYAGERLALVKAEQADLYRRYSAVLKELDQNSLEESARLRETDLLSFEIMEIAEAYLQEGEDEQVERDYQFMCNAGKISEAVGVVYALTGYENGAGTGIGRAIKEIKNVSVLDEALGSLEEQLQDIDSLLNDFNRSAADYMTGLEFDEESFRRTQERLNQINRLKSKYGKTISQILSSKDEKEKKLSVLADYEHYRQNLLKEKERLTEQIMEKCRIISAMRSTHGKSLAKEMRKVLADLNFQDVRFEVEVTACCEEFGADGYDRVVFKIAPNLGEELKPLQQIASGGELSRVMLALKTVQADKNEMNTLIFDEVDAGISGKTAWKVAEKLGLLGTGRQVICITHLPQIAAMADTHFVITKNVRQERTVTSIQKISGEASIHELARLLGSETITAAVLSNAKEMKELAVKSKKI